MPDTFGLQYDGLRKKLAQCGYYSEVVLYGSQTGTTDGELYITGLDSEKPGIPIPADSSVQISIRFAAKYSNNGSEAGTLQCSASRVGNGNVVLGDLVGGAGTSVLSTQSSDAGATTPKATIVPTVDNTNFGIRFVLDQAAGTDISYVMAVAELVCAIKGNTQPPYTGGAEANSPFGVS